MSICELSDIVEAAIRGKVAPFLTEGRAKLEVAELGDSPLISLEPMRDGAAPLEVSIDTEHLVTCFPGRCGMSYEISSKDPREIEGYVCALTKAVIAGSYSERVNDAGAKTRSSPGGKKGERSPLLASMSFAPRARMQKTGVPQSTFLISRSPTIALRHEARQGAPSLSLRDRGTSIALEYAVLGRVRAGMATIRRIDSLGMASETPRHVVRIDWLRIYRE